MDQDLFQDGMSKMTSCDEISTDEKAIQVSHERERPRWRPFALRLPFLMFLLTMTCALIGLLEYTAHAVPFDKKSSSPARSSVDKDMTMLTIAKPVTRTVALYFTGYEITVSSAYSNETTTHKSLLPRASLGIGQAPYLNLTATPINHIQEFNVSTTGKGAYLNATATSVNITQGYNASTTDTAVYLGPMITSVIASMTAAGSPAFIMALTAYLNPTRTLKCTTPSSMASTSAILTSCSTSTNSMDGYFHETCCWPEVSCITDNGGASSCAEETSCTVYVLVGGTWSSAFSSPTTPNYAYLPSTTSSTIDQIDYLITTTSSKLAAQMDFSTPMIKATSTITVNIPYSDPSSTSPSSTVSPSVNSPEVSIVYSTILISSKYLDSSTTEESSPMPTITSTFTTSALATAFIAGPMFYLNPTSSFLSSLPSHTSLSANRESTATFSSFTGLPAFSELITSEPVASNLGTQMSAYVDPMTSLPTMSSTTLPFNFEAMQGSSHLLTVQISQITSVAKASLRPISTNVISEIIDASSSWVTNEAFSTTSLSVEIEHNRPVKITTSVVAVPTTYSSPPMTSMVKTITILAILLAYDGSTITSLLTSTTTALSLITPTSVVAYLAPIQATQSTTFVYETVDLVSRSAITLLSTTTSSYVERGPVDSATSAYLYIQSGSTTVIQPTSWRGSVSSTTGAIPYTRSGSTTVILPTALSGPISNATGAILYIQSSSTIMVQPTSLPGGVTSTNTLMVMKITTPSKPPIMMTTTSIALKSDHLITTSIAYSKLPPSRNPASNSTTLSIDDGTLTVYPWWKSAIGAYLPVALAAIYRTAWSTVFQSAKLVEPFARLANSGGSFATDALFSHYTSSNTDIEAIVSFKGRFWVMFWTAAIHSSTALLPPLASETLRTNTRNCPEGRGGFDPTKTNPCFPELTANKVSLRIVQGYLVYVVCASLCLLLALRRRRTTGLYSDPSSIAGLAALVHNPQLLRDFRAASPHESAGSSKKRLGNNMYGLQLYESASGASRYGIVPLDNSGCRNNSIVEDTISGSTHPSESPHKYEKPRKEKVLELATDIGFGICLAGLLAVIIAYYLDAGDNGFNRFFNSNTFGPRFILTVAAGLIGTQWNRTRKEIQTLDVYRRLSQGRADPRRTLLCRRSVIPFCALFSSFRHGNWLLAWVSIITILSQILIITVSGIPYSEGELWTQMLVCTYLSIGILSLMLLTLPMLAWWKTKLPVLPRQPDTVGAVISYVFASRAVQEWEELEFLSTEERDQKIAGSGTTWTYGEMDCEVDGTRRWMIDEE